MKFSKSHIDYIKKAAKVAKLVGIEALAIEKTVVRGMDESKSVVICTTENIPDIEFDGIGIGRLDVILSRLALIEERTTFSSEADTNIRNNETQVSQLTFKAKNIKVDYRCADTRVIKAPKAIKDPMTFTFRLNQDIVDTLIKAQSAMGVDDVTLISNEEGMSIELIDATNNDVFSYNFGVQALMIDNQQEIKEFVFRYPVKILTGLFKQDALQTIEIGEKGTMKCVVLGISVYVLRVV